MKIILHFLNCRYIYFIYNTVYFFSIIIKSIEINEIKISKSSSIIRKKNIIHSSIQFWGKYELVGNSIKKKI